MADYSLATVVDLDKGRPPLRICLLSLKLFQEADLLRMIDDDSDHSTMGSHTLRKRREIRDLVETNRQSV